jgi:thiol-disulfide isomerase/thioredoxin
MDQPNPKLRMAAMAATFIALLALSVPFVWQHPAEAERPSAPPALEPLASHESEAMMEEQDGGACMADAKPANLNFRIKNLNFWATWCGPCKAEIPGFVELQEKYRDQLTIIGYSVDDDAPKARAFAEQYKINYPILLGEGREDVQDAYGPIYGIPASFLISKDGRVCKKHMGIAPKAVFEKEIQALIAAS